ncbi:related to tpa inducible protein [Rhynchosporium graminicola]|uniref:Related to tpa inducible protein n=1 Tax=Rhynchosporium graminicola TaxID=2792576 RepID=A0A1E1K2J0_9HELO|nr:related to tpa inducible protein [Rhynchosporium commune]
MEGHNGHGYVADDMSYDDLMSDTNWPGSNDQQFHFQQQQQQPVQYANSQQNFHDQYNLSHHQHQHPQYPAVTYSNSPYVPQYPQHARPSDVFGPSASFTEPALNGPTGYHGNDSSFSFGINNLEPATIAPQNLQYSIPPGQNTNRTISASTLQRQQNGLVDTLNQRSQDAIPTYYQPSQIANFQTPQNSNLRYPNLPNDTATEPRQIIKNVVDDSPYQNVIQTAPSSLQQIRVAPPPNPLRFTYPATDEESKTRLPYAPFLAWDDEPIHVPNGLKTALPKYQPRKPRSGKDVVPGLDLSTTLKPAATSAKRGRPRKIKAPVSQYQGTSQGPKPTAVNKLRDDGSREARSPSVLTETSSSEEEDSSEESEYEDEEEMPLVDIATIRGHTRPTSAPEAARWDAIGIIWKDPNSSPSNEVVSEAVQEYGNFLSALRVQIKANSLKIEEAAARPADAQRLKNERLILLESLYQIIDVANKLGYAPIVENLGGHHKMVNGLTTTLIECIKVEDYKGKLPTAIFTLLARFQNMSDDLLKRLKFDSIQKRWIKKGADETKQIIIDILANTIDARERAAKMKPDVDQVEKEKKMRDKVDLAKPQSSLQTPNSTKRPLEGDSTNGKANKKFALDTTSTFNPSSKPTPIRRSGTNLLGIAAKPPTKALPKKREVSPPTESKLGAILASIEQPPELRKAPVIPARAPETPQEKSRRERKESRRHLRVKFKDGPELEQIRIFKHEQVEDEGRQDEMLRDAHDDRSEGMMHKQRVLEVMDDEEEYQPMDADDLPYPEPKAINLSSVEKSTRFGATYTTRGGNLEVSTPEQRTQQRREGLELMVVYTDTMDIPPSAKEPHQVDTGMDDGSGRNLKGPTEPWLVERLQEINQYGPEQATQRALLRQSEEQWKSASQPDGTTVPSGNMSSALQQSSAPTQQVSMPSTKHDLVVQQVLEHLQRITDSLKGLPFPATEPPQWMTNPAQRHIWIEGYNRDMGVRHQVEIERNIAQLQAAQFQAPAVPAQYQHQALPLHAAFTPPMHPPHQAVPDVAQQVQGYLASFQNGGQNQQPDYTNWGVHAGLDQGSNYAVQHQQPHYDQSWGNENRNPKDNRSQETQAGKSKRGYEMKTMSTYEDSPFDENGEYKGKKKPCRFFREGKCAKGNKCTYLHE